MVESLVIDVYGSNVPVVIKLNEIGYYRDEHTGNYIVVWTPAGADDRQRIVVLAGAFFRICPHVDRRSTAGCTYVSDAQLLELGFVLELRPHSYV